MHVRSVACLALWCILEKPPAKGCPPEARLHVDQTCHSTVIVPVTGRMLIGPPLLSLLQHALTHHSSINLHAKELTCSRNRRQRATSANNLRARVASALHCFSECTAVGWRRCAQSLREGSQEAARGGGTTTQHKYNNRGEQADTGCAEVTDAQSRNIGKQEKSDRRQVHVEINFTTGAQPEKHNR